MSEGIKLIIGLQNPGSAYENTRHNAGGWFVDTLAKRDGLSLKTEKKLHCRLTILSRDNQPCRLAIPSTYMNHSGKAVQALCQYFKIASNEILVAHDDLDLAAGRVKLKTGGGHGGHNGLRDIINKLGTQGFHRLRIGIDHPGHKDLVHSYVLNKPSSKDRQNIFDAIERGMTVLPALLKGDIACAMNRLNG